MKRIGMLLAVAGALALAACGEAELVDDNTVVAEEDIAQPLPAPATPAPANVACSQLGLIDRDGDTRVTRAEYDAFGDGVFGDWDADDDNRISLAEYQRCWTAGGFYNGNVGDHTTTFEAFDANDDNFLTEDEFFGDASWRRWDADTDGALMEDDWLR